MLVGIALIGGIVLEAPPLGNVSARATGNVVGLAGTKGTEVDLVFVKSPSAVGIAPGGSYSPNLKL